MTIQYVLLRWKRDFSKKENDDGTPIDNTTTPYGKRTVESNVFIGVHDWIASAFNIPVLTEQQATAIKLPQGNRKQHRRSIIDAETGTQSTIVVGVSNTTVGLSVPDGKIARLKHPTLRGATGKPSKVGISFPSYFKVPMVCQALGQMIPANRSPGFFELEPNWATYPIIINTATAPLEGCDCGAWVVTTDAADVNTTDTDQVPDTGTTVVAPRKGRS